MKAINWFISIIIIGLPFDFFCQQSNPDPNQITIGVKNILFSETLNEEREVWVHVPRTSVDGRKFPVLYLLDGEYHFESVVGIMKSNVISNIIPEMIIVGIRNTNRYRDLTTSHVGDDANPSGGGDNFIKFIETELIPFIDREYPTIDYKTIIGHSLGGLVVASTLINKSYLFDNYLAIDPSLSWGDQRLLNHTKQTINSLKLEDKSIFIGIANTINNDKTSEAMSFDNALEDTTTNTLHLRSIVEFSELLNLKQDIHSTWKYYPEETHGTVPVIAEHEAFRFLFSWYKFKHWDKFYAQELKHNGDELVGILVKYYEDISKIMRHSFLPKEREVNRLAYFYLDKKDYERALPFFELNIKNFPKSANAYDSIGDYYNSVTDKMNAIKYFKKSMEHGGVDGTHQKLEELQKKN